MKVRIIKKLSTVIEVESVEEVERMYKDKEILILEDIKEEVEFEEVREEDA